MINGLHLHLMLSHFPVLGVLFGTLLLLAGLARRSRALQQTGLAVLVLSGLAGGGVFLTGEGAEEAVEHQVSGGEGLIQRHEEAAIIGLVAASIAALVALAALIHGRRGRPLSRVLVVLSLVAALGASGAFTWVANLGGQIGHPEIRSGARSSIRTEAEFEPER